MRPIAKRLAGGLTTAAERAAQLHAFLSKLVVQSQAATERYWTVLDTGDRNLAGTLGRGDFRCFGNLTRVQKLPFQVSSIAIGFGS